MAQRHVQDGDKVEMQALSAADVETDDYGSGSKQQANHLTGWRRNTLMGGLWISLFLSALETTIVSTSLVSITNALQAFSARDWVVMAYLLTYTGFFTVYAKLSDIFGRKDMLVLALAIFTVSSILCGISNNIVQLVVFRAMQGIGASGIYSMVLVMVAGLDVSPAKVAQSMAVVSSVAVVSNVLGPLLGGVISEGGSASRWRWVFLLNGPGGAVALLLILVSLHGSDAAAGLPAKERLRAKFASKTLRRIDYLGMLLVLASSVLFVFALSEGGSRFPWRSPVVIASLVIAVVAGAVFWAWEILLERKTSWPQEPVFPPSILRDRLTSAILLTAFLVGFPCIATIVNIPQRAQAVNARSALEAGLTLLPLMLTMPLGSVLGPWLTVARKMPSCYVVVASSVLQLLGVGLSVSYPTRSTHVPRAQYGFDVLMGLGFGMGLTTLVTFAREVVHDVHLAVMMAAVTQVRMLGGTVALAICAALLKNHVHPRLEAVLSPNEIMAITDSLAAINNLTATQQAAVRVAFAEGYKKQNIFLAVVTALSLVTACFLWERSPRGAAYGQTVVRASLRLGQPGSKITTQQPELAV